MKSQLKKIGAVTFPKFNNEKVYMLPFLQAEGLPKHLSHWQPTIDAMLRGLRTVKPIYLMIDQGEVKAGQTHRRGGAHIDGNWIEKAGRHGGHSTHTTFTNWDTGGSGNWSKEGLKPEALILASDISACKAYVGNFEGSIGKGGDCSHLDLVKLQPIKLEANKAYIGNVTMIHESLPVMHDCKRTVVRLNAPGVTF